MTNSDIVACRSMFCKDCEDKQRPLKGTRVVLKRGKRNDMVVKKSTRHVTDGITPHLIQRAYVKNEKIVLHVYCGVDGCGLNLRPNEQGSWNIYWRTPHVFHLTTKEYNVLINKWKDTGYEV